MGTQNEEHSNRDTGIYPSTLIMSIFWKKIEFYKGKSVCKVIVFAAWSLGHSPGGLSGDKGPNFLAFQSLFNQIKWLTMALKNCIHHLRSYTSS